MTNMIQHPIITSDELQGIFYNPLECSTHSVIQGKRQLNLTVGEILFVLELIGRERERLVQGLPTEADDNPASIAMKAELRRIDRIIDRLRSQAKLSF